MAVLNIGESRLDHAWRLPSGSGLQGGSPEEIVAPRKWRWPFGLALLAWAVYSAAAVWMTESQHLEIGDSIARMADARAMLFSRDPHLAAIGLYWMPLPTVGQLPFMLILSPLHHAELSGPLACALVGALTVLVMARICWILNLSSTVAAFLVGVYAFSPIVVYTNGNGMSEAWLFLACSVAMLGYLRWSKHHRTIDLAVIGAGLALVMLVRYEALVLTPIVAMFAALNDGRPPPRRTSVRDFIDDCRSKLRRWTTTAAIIALPTYFVIALWMFMQYVLANDPLRWYELQKSQGHTFPGAYPNLPAHTGSAIGGYVLHMVMAITPAVAIVAPALLLLKRRWQDILTGGGLVAAALVWPLIVGIGLVLNESAGAPRYFEPSLVFITIGAMWLATPSRSWSRTARRLVPAALIAFLAVGAVGGALSLESPKATSIESENLFFGPVFGHRTTPLSPSALNSLTTWIALGRDLDTRLAGGAIVLSDISVETRAYVFSRYPGRYIVNSDRDYQRILADPVGKFTYLIRASDLVKASDIGAFDGILAITSGGHWVKWKSYSVATIYQWIPDLAGPA